MKNNFRYDDIFSENDKEKIREDYTTNELSLREICEKYNIKSKSYAQKVLKSVMRSISEANVIAHKRKKESFKHSGKTKEKMRESRLKYMKEHPENTAWRKRNLPSYPEQCFIKFLIEKGYDKKFLIEREHPIFPFFIDFAFIDLKIAIEIDGSQHILDEKRKEKDLLKNEILIKNGWRVFRISENLVKTDWETLYKKMEDIIGNKTKTFEKVGILKAPKTRQKVSRNENGLSLLQERQHFNQRKIKNRPSKEILLDKIKTKSFCEIGREYGVTDNTIRKWCKIYQLPYRKKDLKNRS